MSIQTDYQQAVDILATIALDYNAVKTHEIITETIAIYYECQYCFNSSSVGMDNVKHSPLCPWKKAVDFLHNKESPE